LIEELEHVPPCRVLMRDGIPCEAVIVQRPRFDSAYKAIDIPATPKSVFVPSVRAVGRPRTRPVKAKPHQGRGLAWNRNELLTIEKIRELQAEGLTAAQIGERCECTAAAVYFRLRIERRSTPEAAAIDKADRTCGCGGRKLPTRERCIYCVRGAKSKAAAR